MKIANNAEMLEIKGERGALYPVLLWDGAEVVLIDTALPGQTEPLGEAVRQAGFELEQITKVLLTHQDMDHIGSAKALAGLGAEILAHKVEAPYIQGGKTSVRIVEMEKRLPEMDGDERAFFERMKAGAPLFTVPVSRALTDGELLDFCGGIQVIHTPGHTPGHMALLLKESNIVVAGDAANISGGALTGADPYFTLDMPQAEASFQKIKALNPAAVICYHGGLYLQK
ncbi:MAG: MBL fold metallo-hydrolase [Oscillospiraceae bacterium]|jgi:glyoxylase-like metal-dependent hydrolase (beta-lactamase superfamily II)|nr:MBL fold metallo-hydrolase [Oscillospiraceae bacterium]